MQQWDKERRALKEEDSMCEYPGIRERVLESSVWSVSHIKDFKLHTKTNMQPLKNFKQRSDVVRY